MDVVKWTDTLAENRHSVLNDDIFAKNAEHKTSLFFSEVEVESFDSSLSGER
jgi:hypothetical protein